MGKPTRLAVWLSRTGNDRERLRWVDYPASVALAAVGLGSIAFLTFLLSRNVDFLLVGVALAACSIPFALAALMAPGRLLSPLTLVGATMLLGVAGQTAFMVLLASPEEKYMLLSGVDQAGLIKGLGVTTAGTFCLAVGYLIGHSRKRQAPGEMSERVATGRLARPSESRMTLVVLALCAIATVSLAILSVRVGITSVSELLTSKKRFVEIGGSASSLGYLRFGVSLAGAAFVLAVYTIIDRKLRWKSSLGAFALVALLITLISAVSLSSRSELIVPTLTATLLVISARQFEPRLRVVVAVLAAGLLAVTLLGGLRAVGQGSSATIGESLGTAADVAEAPLASRDWMAIGALSAVVDRVPGSYPFQYGATMVSFIWAPVPRSLWPAKPSVRLGPEIGPDVYGFPRTRITGDPPGFLGELWINGGWPFTLVGMTCFGFLLEWVNRWYTAIPRWGTFTALIYSVLAVALGLQLPIADVTGVILALAQSVLPLIVGLWFASSRTALPRLRTVWPR